MCRLLVCPYNRLLILNATVQIAVRVGHRYVIKSPVHETRPGAEQPSFSLFPRTSQEPPPPLTVIYFSISLGYDISRSAARSPNRLTAGRARVLDDERVSARHFRLAARQLGARSSFHT
jgi:hypothetical protein